MSVGPAGDNVGKDDKKWSLVKERMIYFFDRSAD
jgi:hypothetical protein